MDLFLRPLRLILPSRNKLITLTIADEQQKFKTGWRFFFPPCLSFCSLLWDFWVYCSHKMQSFRMFVMSVVRRKEVSVILKSRCKILFDSVPRLWTRDPRPIKYERNAQNAIYHAHLNILSLVIWSRVFWLSLTWNLLTAQPWSKSA